jgi:hypothetical protein
MRRLSLIVLNRGTAMICSLSPLAYGHAWSTQKHHSLHVAHVFGNYITSGAVQGNWAHSEQFKALQLDNDEPTAPGTELLIHLGFSTVWVVRSPWPTQPGLTSGHQAVHHDQALRSHTLVRPKCLQASVWLIPLCVFPPFVSMTVGVEVPLRSIYRAL